MNRKYEPEAAELAWESLGIQARFMPIPEDFPWVGGKAALEQFSCDFFSPPQLGEGRPASGV